MRSHPALFTGPMVRAMLDGRKTQTRRPIRISAVARKRGRGWVGGPLPDRSPKRVELSDEWAAVCGVSVAAVASWLEAGVSMQTIFPAPWQPGDLLWVRETWLQTGPDGDPDSVTYRADNPSGNVLSPCDFGTGGYPEHCRNHPGCAGCYPSTYPWRPSIHMPRWAARIWREVTGVRVERVGDISEEDAIAEGPPPNWTYDLTGWDPTEHGYLTAAGLRHVQRHPGNDCDEDGTVPGTGDPAYVFTARESFLSLWTSIYGPGSDAGWCFAYDLRPAEAPHE